MWAGGSRWEGRAEFGTSGPEGHKGFEGFSQTADRAMLQTGEKTHRSLLHLLLSSAWRVKYCMNPREDSGSATVTVFHSVAWRVRPSCQTPAEES